MKKKKKIFSLERLGQQNESHQRTISLLEQNLQIAQHDLEVAKKDL